MSFRKNAKVWRATWSSLPPDTPTIQDVRDVIESAFGHKSPLWVIGYERHPEPADPDRPFHIHAHIQFDTKVDSTNCRILDVKGYHPSIAGRFGPAYAAKDGCYITNRMDEHVWRPVPKPRVLEPSFQWQLDLVKRLKEEPDDRTIIWCWESKGGAGKTQFAKWAIVTKELGEAILVGGKAADAKFAISKMLERRLVPRVIFFNIARGAAVSYRALEELKDGIFFSGKYESAMVTYDPPHIVCFSNEAPETARLSADRWDVIDISRPTASTGPAALDPPSFELTDDDCFNKPFH